MPFSADLCAVSNKAGENEVFLMGRSSLSTTTTAAKEARKLLRPLRGELKRLLCDLIRTNTVAIPPNGNETPAQLILRDFLREKGLRPEVYKTDFITRSGSHLLQKNRNYAGRKNLVVRLAGSGRGKSLLLNGHMDTVPPGKTPWAASPWSGSSSKGRIYGLGSIDMKGGLVANAGVACALRAAGARLGGDLICESVIDEEWGGGGGTLAARLRGDSADACVVSEGTHLDIFRGTRGGFVVDLIVEAGDPASYFSQGEVLSPAIPMGRLLGWVDSLSQRRKKVRKFGAYASFPDPAPVQVLAIEANGFDPVIPLSVPLTGAVRLYMQFLPHENVSAVIAEIRNSLTAFQKSDVFFRAHSIRWKPVLEQPLLGHEIPLEHPWTRCMTASASAALGKEPVVTGAPYPCDASLIHREFGIPTLVFGPCGAGSHNPDEYVEFMSVMQTAEVLLTAALEWCVG
ncbi:MAG: M20/M25/M40 family metallo-hydrolase [Silvibacterium sp.]